ncbi:MAG TPA: CheR family methyltransferase [Steroidobacteraceae bacterium]
MRVDPAPDTRLRRLSEIIADKTGLHFPAERYPDLQRGLAAAAADFGFADDAGCADWLLSASLTAPQLNVLASHLTIGETYFFRERKTFDALAECVLPELFRRCGRERRLRLWSAACSTGEEPYSLAILVQQLLPDWQDWDLTILATDINQGFLHKAIAGVFGEWSFRQAPAGLKERYFTPTPEGRFAISPQISKCVRFAHLNLSQDCFPSLTNGTNAMDLILCRNVLIYFTAAHARKLVGNLRRSLADEGWLAVSPSECSQALFPRFAAVNFPGGTLYRKSNAEALSPPPATPPTGATAHAAPSISAPQPSPQVAAEQSLPRAAGLPQLGQHEFSQLTRDLANQGRLADALATSERWIAADRVDFAAHYVHAMVLEEMGEREAARRSLGRAVYLEPNFALAHFVLGNLARADARSAEANRHFANALYLLRGCAPEMLLPESDGMTAGALEAIIMTLLAKPDPALAADKVSLE